MNSPTYHLLRLAIFVMLALALGAAPLADAQAPQQSAPAACQENPIPGRITGTVRDGEGNPLPNVTVTAHATTGTAPLVGTTNAAGEYALSPLPGSYRLEFKPAGAALQTAWYKSGTSALDATAVEVLNGRTSTGFDITLPIGAQLNVALRNAAGAPVEQALIFVYDRLGRKLAEGTTDGQGRALTAPGLPPGDYRLLARPPYGSPLLASYYNQQPTLDAADVITITQASGRVDVAMTLQQAARLSGTATDGVTGTALSNIAVAVLGADGDSWFAATDDQGRYSIVGLPSQTYRVVVGFRAGLTTPAAPAPLVRTVALVAPNGRGNFDAALTAGGTLSGRVTTPAGAPIADVSVNVRDLNSDYTAYAATAADGSYAVYGLPSGRYTLAYSVFNGVAAVPSAPVTVTAPNTTSVATAVLSAGGAISGKVTGPDGLPVAGVYVSVLDASGKTEQGSGSTNADGIYTTAATLASGSYIVKFQPPSDNRGCPLAIEYSGNAANASAATKVQVSAPATATGVDATLDYGSFIAGQISDGASGAPLYGEVLVYDATGSIVTNGNVSSLGYYRSSAGLPLGSYRLQFKAEGYVTLFFGGASVLEAAAGVPSGSTDANMSLRRGGTLSGQISAEDTGAPLEHALVTLYGSGDRVIDTQLTIFDGSFSFRSSLPSGTYRVGVAPGQRADGTPYFTGYEAIFSGGARSLAQAQPINLVAPQTISADLAMPYLVATADAAADATTIAERPARLSAVERALR